VLSSVSRIFTVTFNNLYKDGSSGSVSWRGGSGFYLPVQNYYRNLLQILEFFAWVYAVNDAKKPTHVLLLDLNLKGNCLKMQTLHPDSGPL
jgi:hypothetical protein